MSNNFYVTSPIYYVNDRPHIGHAYTTLACDIIARFKRLDGFNVMFLTGTDEHGQKVAQAAQNRGLDPQDFTDNLSNNFKELANAMHCSFDDFIRTTEDRHKHASRILWEELLGREQIYLDSYSGWYAVRDEAYYTESELTKNAEGKMIAPSGAEATWVEEPSYFFKLSSWQDKLLEFYEENPDFIAPTSRRNEVMRFVAGGLRDLSISRTTFDWGVKVPNDEDHVMYVWLDALTNYLTALGYPDTQAEPYQNFWPASLHIVGKDILRFHAVYWPAFLMAANLPVPKRVFAHGWWTNEGQKMSKSLGNVIDPHAMIAQYGIDQFRYFLMRELPFGNDGDFSHDNIVSRSNNDLANDFGNLVQRVLSMIHKNCDGQVSELDTMHDDDRALLGMAYSLLDTLRELVEQQAFHKMLEAIWGVVGAANRYVDAQAPWKMQKTDPQRMRQVLSVLYVCIRRLAIATQPFMPTTSAFILDQMGCLHSKRSFADWGDACSHIVIGKPDPVFHKFG
ncbi:MAG: methionine--tRNA ligase [Pseudomonadota bacterium]